MEIQQTIQLNSSGAAVKNWQNFLIQQGFDLGPSGADGNFGNKTDTATRAFQSQQQLAVDGIVGSLTYAAAEALGFKGILHIADFIGIDVYHGDGNIQWDLVKKDPQNIRFAFIKATEGATVQDPSYQKNMQGATSVGLSTGAYHFFSLTSTAESQADNFIQVVGDHYPYSLPPVLDYEKDIINDAISATVAVQTWLSIVENKYGIKPIIYTSSNYWGQLNNPAGFDQYTLWLADYNKGLPAIPGTWDQWVFWQYSDQGVVSGIGNNVDLNNYNSNSNMII